jgi:hypothetical protein
MAPALRTRMTCVTLASRQSGVHSVYFQNDCQILARACHKGSLSERDLSICKTERFERDCGLETSREGVVHTTENQSEPVVFIIALSLSSHALATSYFLHGNEASEQLLDHV